MKNWKTTLAGMIGAVATVVLPMVTGGAVSSKDVVTAAVLAALGFFAKDSNVTGGTVEQ